MNGICQLWGIMARRADATGAPPPITLCSVKFEFNRGAGPSPTADLPDSRRTPR
jgi:hypothetical protein